ncbi:MAG: zinc ribbon domain-containing protein [Lacticaseibacillus songhuajiangensis]|nr:zinc ribbon domain-containing protein [Lacticaseibacillus songhuajiangensis]
METCPSCGAALKPGAKFCTHCGFKIEQPAAPQQSTPTPAASAQPVATPAQQQQATSAVPPVPPVTPQQAAAPQQPTPQAATPNPNVDHAKNVLKAYWQWLLASLKHPSVDAGLENKWTGYSSFGLIALFSALALLVPPLRWASRATDAASGFLSSFSSDASSEVASRAGGMAGGVFFGSLIAMIIYVCAMLLLVSATAFIIRRNAMAETVTFTGVVNEYARGISLAVFLSGIVMILNVVFASLGLYALSFVVLAFCYLLATMTYFRVALNGTAQSHFDIIYIMVVAAIILGIISFFITSIFWASVLSNVFSQFGSSFGGLL